MPFLAEKTNLRSPQRVLLRLSGYGSTAIASVMSGSLGYASNTWQMESMTTTTLIENSCLDCHDEFEQKGNLNLETLPTVSADPSSIQMWLQVYDRVASGEMPPKKKRFSLEEKNRFTDTLGAELRRFDAERQSSLGRVILRRLNVSEYENIIRDLLDLPGLTVAQYVPADPEYHGIENVADMQQMAYNQIAQYLEAAETSLQAAVALRPKPDLAPKRYAPEDLGAHRKAFRSAKALVDNKIVVIKEPVESQGPWGFFTSPAEPGYYKIRLRAHSARIANSDIVNASEPIVPPKLLSGVKDQTVALSISLGRFLGSFNVTPEAGTFECTVWLHGNERLAFHCPDLPFRDTKFTSGNKPEIWDAVAIKWAEIEGPLITDWPPQGHRLLFGNLPLEAWSEASGYLAPRTIAMGTGEIRQVKDIPGGPFYIKSKNPARDSKRLLREFMERAYRRPVRSDEVNVMQTRVLDAIEQGICFQDAMLIAYKAILCSPDFLFVHETPGRLSGNELATRLSLYLWRSLPDKRLIKLGKSGALKKPSVLLAEAKRMLNDPKTDRFIDDFTNQWLELDAIYATAPDKKLYPEYNNDDLLVENLVEETRSYVGEMIRYDLPIAKVVNSDFSFLNERLARHYNISGVSGSELRKVTLPTDSVRGGILTQGSIMKISANGFTTSPVKRGMWVLDRILGIPPAPPPPDAGAIEPDTRGAVTIREQLDKHRRVESCASCHLLIDPPGFALESFDVMGGYRTHYRSIDKGVDETMNRGQFRYDIRLGLPVDASGNFSGESFSDIKGFKNLLEKEDRQIARNTLNRLLIHSTGAIATFSDRAVIEQLLDANAANGYGLRSLILSILDTPMFLHK